METTMAATPSCGACGTEVFTIRVSPGKAVLVCIWCGAENEIASAGRRRRSLSFGLFRGVLGVLRNSDPGATDRGRRGPADFNIEELPDLPVRAARTACPMPEETSTDVLDCSSLWSASAESWTGYSSAVRSFTLTSHVS